MTDNSQQTAGYPQTPLLLIDRRPPLIVITINRPAVRNAVDGPTAQALAAAFRAFDMDTAVAVAILTGAGEHFCAGADLKAVASQEATRTHQLSETGDGPMGPTRLQLSKPVIAAIDGFCVAGGLELALWCDLRVASDRATFGVFCRRFGVPLIDGGTVRLPRLIGMSRAMDMILTGRPVDSAEALQFGLANRRVAAADLMTECEQLALEISRFPQDCLHNDRASAYAQWSLDETSAMTHEFQHGMKTLASGETLSGATRFKEGSGRHGEFGC